MNVPLERLMSFPTPLLVVGGVLLFLVATFLVFFLVRGGFVWWRLFQLQRAFARLKSGGGSSTGPDSCRAVSELDKAFARDRHLLHLWKEYRESLHEQRAVQDGQDVVTALRATMPAEMYFNGQSVVDGRLRTEFFKHLPGLLTGIGIIGTFTGLIGGLESFHVSEDADTVRGSLSGLMNEVGEAFLVSASAIGAAMLVTFLEKLLLSSLYRRIEKIAQDIDACFVAGAGEEYLSRLVRASEDSASQSKILKDALVNELGTLLRELTKQQIESSQQQQQRLLEDMKASARENNQALGDAINGVFREPLEKIAGAVQVASGEQSAMTTTMLQDVMSQFSARLNELFGGQISGLNELNQQTARSMQEAVSTLQALVQNIEATSGRASDDMAKRFAEAIAQMEKRQQAMNEQSEAFIGQIRALVSQSTAETNEKLRETLAAIGTTMREVMNSLSESQDQVAESVRKLEETMVSRTESAVRSLSDSVDSVIQKMAEISTQIAQSINKLEGVTTTSIGKMESSAGLLAAASLDFAKAGSGVAGVLEKATTASSGLTEASSAFQDSAASVKSALQDYRLQRDAMAAMTTELKATVEAARREASLTTDIVSRIEQSAQGLGRAQLAANEYLNGLNEVLGGAQGAFAASIRKTLDTANVDFHKKLSDAVNLLSAAVSELEASLASVGASTPPGKSVGRS